MFIMSTIKDTAQETKMFIMATTRHCTDKKMFIMSTTKDTAWITSLEQ